MREIQLNELRPALDQFSKTHQGWMAALQDSDEVVKQTEARDLPLLGISADSHDGENDIVIMLGDRPERHVTHVIHRPAHVRIEDHLEGKEETIDIERRGGGHITLRCYQSTGSARMDEVSGSGVYPMSRPEGASPNAPLQGEMSWGQGERGAEGYFDHGDSELTLRDVKKTGK
ncbi:MAG TPA: DUF5335 family protein [Bryobacteraceae bacterium]|jgi:hypothetical protein|nr:DUF5335 family protein [Bryobacteraceae bacterium]